MAHRSLIYMIFTMQIMFARWDLCDTALERMFTEWDLYEAILAQHIMTPSTGSRWSRS